MAARLEWLRLLTVFAMLGSIMFVSDILMEFLPNVHIVGLVITLGKFLEDGGNIRQY